MRIIYKITAAVLAQILILAPVLAQDAPAKKETVTVRKSDLNLNEDALRNTVIDYAFPAVLAPAAELCAAADIEECYAAYKKFEDGADASVSARANMELAVLAMQRGLPDAAVNYADKAASLAPKDPFAELLKGWLLLSGGDFKDAKKSFEKMMFLTSSYEYVSYSRLGKALANYYLGNKRETLDDFFFIYSNYPYMISLASFMLGKSVLEREGKKQASSASVFASRSITHDRHNFPALLVSAQAFERQKKDINAWQQYAMIYTFDKTDKTARKKLKKLSKDFTKDASEYLVFLRLSLPIVGEYEHIPSETIKMALYAGVADNTPVRLKEATVIGASSYKAFSEDTGNVLSVSGLNIKKLVFNAETKSVSILDRKGNVDFVSAYPFTLTPDKHNTILVKSVQSDDIFAADFSDKELKGSLTVTPKEDGFTLVNSVSLEDLLPALLFSASGDLKEQDGLEALAIALRTYVSALAAEAGKDAEYNFTDGHDGIEFNGVNMERDSFREAAKETRGLFLTDSADVFPDCGAYQGRGVRNSAAAPQFVYSPVNVFKYMISNPPKDLFSEPDDDTLWAPIKWQYLYGGKDIARRAAAVNKIGTLRAVVPLRTSRYGNVEELLLKGSSGDLRLEGGEIGKVLSARMLRSNFFTAIPVYKGKNVRDVLFFGVNTGHGEGLCVKGAAGMEEKGYMEILYYYFPGTDVVKKY